MNQSKFLQWAVWGGLSFVILAVGIAFLVGGPRARLKGLSTGSGSLPVIKPLSEFSLTNQLGQVVSVDSLAGHPWVANVFFSRCPSICVKMTQRMKEIQDSVPPESPLRLVSISTDPDHDQPEVLTRYAKRFGADSGRWFFLTGEKSEIARAIQKELLLAVQENAEDQRQSELDLYTHSSLLVLVDKDSRVRATYESLGTNTVAEIVADLKRLD